MHCPWEESGKETYLLIADIEELEQVGASELHARSLNAKVVLTPQRSGNFIFLVADGTVKIFGRAQHLGTPTTIGDRPERGDEQEVLRGESDGLSSPTPLQDGSTLDDAEARNDFWSVAGDFICRHHGGTPIRTARARKKNHFPFR